MRTLLRAPRFPSPRFRFGSIQKSVSTRLPVVLASSYDSVRFGSHLPCRLSSAPCRSSLTSGLNVRPYLFRDAIVVVSLEENQLQTPGEKKDLETISCSSGRPSLVQNARHALEQLYK